MRYCRSNTFNVSVESLHHPHRTRKLVTTQTVNSPASKCRVLHEQKRGGLEGSTKRRTAMKIATVASVTYLRGGGMKEWTQLYKIILYNIWSSRSLVEWQVITDLETEKSCIRTLLWSWRYLSPSRQQSLDPLWTTSLPAEWRDSGHWSLQRTWAPAYDAAHGSHYRQKSPFLSSQPHSPTSFWSWRDHMGKKKSHLCTRSLLFMRCKFLDVDSSLCHYN